MTGSQKKFDHPTQKVTSRLSEELNLRTLLPKVALSDSGRDQTLGSSGTSRCSIPKQ